MTEKGAGPSPAKDAVDRFQIRQPDGTLSRVYEFDGSHITVKELRVLSKKGGLGLTAFGIGLRMGNPEALVGRLWIAMTRAGEAVRWEDFDDFDLGTYVAYVPPVNDDQPGAANEDRRAESDPTTTPPGSDGTT